MSRTPLDQVVKLTRSQGLLRPRDLVAVGIPRQYLRLALDRKMIERVGRGLYRIPGVILSEHQSLAEVCLRAPHGVICLLSALQYHELTTQMPSEVWLAIGESSHRPRIDFVSVRVTRFSGPALTEGVEDRAVGGGAIRVYCAAKTVADCFKYRNKIGQDVAVEVLLDYLRRRKGSVDDLVRYSRICRVERVMGPYLEAML